MKILTLVSIYLPGYKSGGPLRTIASMVEQLGEPFDFWILTGDRDLHDSEPYPDLSLDQWISVGQAHVYYTDLSLISLRKLSKLIAELKPDIVYLNSFFSSLNNKYLLARWLGMIPQIPTIVAPRGVFSPGAIRIKPLKKRFYLRVLQRGGLFKGVSWQASSPMEKKDILAAVSSVEESEIWVAPDLAGGSVEDLGPSNNGRDLTKEPGHVRFVFLSRISVKKNLKLALSLLGSLAGRIDFDIVGPIEDHSYWNACQQIINELPENVAVQSHGPIPHEEVNKAFRNAHFFLFPTLGENFGHVILEALQAGCPVIISDQTPWNDLRDSEAGWVIPLKEEKQWVDALQYCVDMDQDSFATHAKNARQYAARWLASIDVLQANRDMFLAATGDHDR